MPQGAKKMPRTLQEQGIWHKLCINALSGKDCGRNYPFDKP